MLALTTRDHAFGKSGDTQPAVLIFEPLGYQALGALQVELELAAQKLIGRKAA